MEFLSFIKKHWYLFSFLAIVLLAIVLRFYNYPDRWGLAYDQAHDAIVARYALEQRKIPLVGPFSSAGPFQTGGEWYWFIMLGTLWYPFLVNAPWIFLTVFYVFFVAGMILLGTKISGRAFGLLVGVLSAVSTAQIAQSVSLTNQSPLSLVSFGALWFMVDYVKSKKPLALFFMGLFISLAATIHLQGVVLVIFFVVTLLFTGIPSISALLFFCIGVFIPLIPLLIFDLQNNFLNSRNMLQYYLHDQYKISLDVLNRRWLTFGGLFIPKVWSHVIGGDTLLGYVGILGIIVTAVITFFKKDLTKVWLIIGMSTVGMIALIRYVRTPIFESYIVFLHPFILLLTAWMLVFFYKYYKTIGIVLMTLIFYGSFMKDLIEIKGGTNYSLLTAETWMKAVDKKYKDKKFAIYDYGYSQTDKSFPFVFLLAAQNKIDDNGIRIGVGRSTEGKLHAIPSLSGRKDVYALFDLQSSGSASLERSGWAFINPSQVYRATEEWVKYKK